MLVLICMVLGGAMLPSIPRRALAQNLACWSRAITPTMRQRAFAAAFFAQRFALESRLLVLRNATDY